jgi:hypothetical protein
MTTSAFVGTNPTGELITSGSPGEALPGCNEQVVGTTGSMRGIAFVRIVALDPVL